MLSDLHTHSTFSDGINTCEELIEQALSLGLRRIGLVEHVWRKSDWVSEFIEKAGRLKQKYEGVIEIVTGFEAKALTCAGDIDFDDKWKNQVDFIYGSVHRIPSRSYRFYSKTDLSLNKNKVYEDWLSTMQGLLKNDIVDIVAHPAAELTDYGIPLDHDAIRLLSNLGMKYGKIFEINVKHKAPVRDFLISLIAENIPLSIGSDSHSTEEQKLYIKDIIDLHEKMAFCKLI